MVDSIVNIGGAAGANAPNRTKNNTLQPQEKPENQSIQDEISISTEALSLTQVEQSIKDVREQLIQDPNLSLGLSDGFDETI